NYNTGELNETTTYRVLVFANESGCESIYSADVTVTVEPDIEITGQPVGGEICEGGIFTLTVAATGSPGLHYQWEVLAGATWIQVGTDTSAYTTPALNETTTYRVFVS